MYWHPTLTNRPYTFFPDPTLFLSGLPIGLWLLTSADERLVKSTLAVVIIGFALYSLFGRTIRLESESKIGLFLCGLLSGVFGGAYGLNGPPLVVYGVGGDRKSTRMNSSH